MRGRDLNLPFSGITGTHNAITDVPDVAVGYTTLIADDPVQISTGVTAIIPRFSSQVLNPVSAGLFSFNGNGEMTGSHWIEDAGQFSSPVMITNTHSVGRVHHATVGWMIDRYRQEYSQKHLWAMPVVAETYDGLLNDINGQHVTEIHARNALDQAATGALQEGNVGGGTGMITYGFKGGTGTASRVVSTGAGDGVVGVLVQANHGVKEWLTVLGVPVGREFAKSDITTADQNERESGSIIVVVATDLPLNPLQLKRVAKRAALGIGRGGTMGGNSSGDIFLAFSTANDLPAPGSGSAIISAPYLNDDELDVIFESTVLATEEAVINAMLAAESTPLYRETASLQAGSIIEALDATNLERLINSAYR